jgi:hypothetical protein
MSRNRILPVLTAVTQVCLCISGELFVRPAKTSRAWTHRARSVVGCAGDSWKSPPMGYCFTELMVITDSTVEEVAGAD